MSAIKIILITIRVIGGLFVDFCRLHRYFWQLDPVMIRALLTNKSCDSEFLFVSGFPASRIGESEKAWEIRRQIFEHAYFCNITYREAEKDIREAIATNFLSEAQKTG